MSLRQSFDAFVDRKAEHVLSVFVVDHQIILAHEVVDEKSNEIPAVQTLIATLGLSGRCSRSTPCTAKKTFEIARETGNDLIVHVKDNQPSLLRRLEDIAATTAPVAIDDSRNVARSRQEDRCVAVYLPGSALDETEWASLVAAIVRVERQTLIVPPQWTMDRELGDSARASLAASPHASMMASPRCRPARRPSNTSASNVSMSCCA